MEGEDEDEICGGDGDGDTICDGWEFFRWGLDGGIGFLIHSLLAQLRF